MSAGQAHACRAGERGRQRGRWVACCRFETCFETCCRCGAWGGSTALLASGGELCPRRAASSSHLRQGARLRAQWTVCSGQSKATGAAAVQAACVRVGLVTTVAVVWAVDSEPQRCEGGAPPPEETKRDLHRRGSQPRLSRCRQVAAVHPTGKPAHHLLRPLPSPNSPITSRAGACICLGGASKESCAGCAPALLPAAWRR